MTTKKVTTRTTDFKSLVQLTSGKEQPYPVYRFQKKEFVEKPGKAYP